MGLFFFETHNPTGLFFFEKHKPTGLCFSKTNKNSPYTDSSHYHEQFYQTYKEDLFLIPMPGKNSRSHNLANSVSIALYEALRQTDFSTS